MKPRAVERPRNDVPSLHEMCSVRDPLVAISFFTSVLVRPLDRRLIFDDQRLGIAGIFREPLLATGNSADELELSGSLPRVNPVAPLPGLAVLEPENAGRGVGRV